MSLGNLASVLHQSHCHNGVVSGALTDVREFTQGRRRRLRKRHLKSELALPQTYSISFNSFNSSNAGKGFWSWILKDCIKVQEKKKESCCLVFPSSTKREIWQFHFVVVQRRQRNVQESVMHVQSCCLACLSLLLFCRSRCRRRRRCVNSI